VTSAATHDSPPEQHEPDGQPSAAATTAGVAAKQQEESEQEDRWRRCMADLDNLRKRYTRELTREREVERGRVAAAWLPVVDNLERALEHGQSHPESLLPGVRAVRDQALAVLETLGYPRDDQEGVAFDPARHEVVEVVESPELDSGTVVKVLRPGYGEIDRQLRPAAVAVSQRG
jgi:molecular chaperone GrpE